MRHLCDLHTHSTFSDGLRTPREIVELAERRRLAAVALTDHDTLAGLGDAADAASQYPELTFIGGIELSAACTGGDRHILGYYVDPEVEAIEQLAERTRSSRDQRNGEMISRLQAEGIDITMAEVVAAASHRLTGEPVIGRPHMAAVLIAKGVVRALGEAFDRYLGSNCPAYVSRDRPAAAEVVDAIHAAGGVAVLAHPVFPGFDSSAQCEMQVRSLIDKGLDGIEVYHPSHTDAQTRLFLDLARRYDLLVTGGSDYHGCDAAPVALGRPRVPAMVLEPLKNRAKTIQGRSL